MRFMLWEVQRVILGTAKAASHQKVLVVFQFPTHIHGYEHTATQSQHYRRAGLLHQGSDGSAFAARRYPGCRISEATQSAEMFLKIRTSFAVCGVC
jgi:hypothetical protein